MAGTDRSTSVVLPAHASSVSAARRLVGEALVMAGLDAWLDDAQLAVSELVTNAQVHVGSVIGVRVRTRADQARIEVSDESIHPPAPRHYSTSSGTGRGLHLIEVVADRWGVDIDDSGKTVWFELGRETPSPARAPGPSGAVIAPTNDTLVVDLLNFPLLMHQAWQEHASALLREFLLVDLDDENTAPFEWHAQASDAMNLLHEQVPTPELLDDPEAIMASAIEPGVSAPRVSLRLPRASLPNFRTLDDMLGEATALAASGTLLAFPTQPEIQEMGHWICSQVHHQGAGAHVPDPWSPDTDVTRRVDFQTSTDWDDRHVTESERALIATDEAGVITAVSPSAAAFLRYATAEDLVGRRIIRIIPSRYHQAHIAGTALHMTNGRDAFIGVTITAPVVLGDDSEEPVSLVVQSHPLPHGHR
ncbi:MAG: ATP-binding protein, partial [Nocardioidaceae bacterium]|nr:ATP-binding protein [Nocardioidaceae bacterium]